MTYTTLDLGHRKFVVKYIMVNTPGGYGICVTYPCLCTFLHYHPDLLLNALIAFILVYMNGGYYQGGGGESPPHPPPPK